MLICVLIAGFSQLQYEQSASVHVNVADDSLLENAKFDSMITFFKVSNVCRLLIIFT